MGFEPTVFWATTRCLNHSATPTMFELSVGFYHMWSLPASSDRAHLVSVPQWQAESEPSPLGQSKGLNVAPPSDRGIPCSKIDVDDAVESGEDCANGKQP